MNDLIIKTATWITMGIASTHILANDTPRNPARYFSRNYSEARAKFFKAAQDARAEILKFKNPRQGPKCLPLYTDVAFLGPQDAETVLVIVSGTHGVEGYCGSGVQTGLLVNGLDKKLPQGVRVVLIHALNPYGMAWNRRVNEDNIDLNRNFIQNYNNPPTNPDYTRYANLIAPRVYDELFQSRKRLEMIGEQFAKAELRRMGIKKPNSSLLAYVRKFGRQKLQDAISSGQYFHPKGLHFGGKKETWSKRTFRKIVKKYLIHAKQVVLIDLHTGLGPYGHGECILNESPKSSAFKNAQKWFGNIARSTLEESVSSHICGSLKWGFARMFPKGVAVTAISLEFGTFAPEEVFKAMQAENWLHHFAKKKDRNSKPIKAEMLRVFYPDDDNWKKMVWARANYVVDQTLGNILTKD